MHVQVRTPMLVKVYMSECYDVLPPLQGGKGEKGKEERSGEKTKTLSAQEGDIGSLAEKYVATRSRRKEDCS